MPDAFYKDTDVFADTFLVVGLWIRILVLVSLVLGCEGLQEGLFMNFVLFLEFVCVLVGLDTLIAPNFCLSVCL